LTIIYCLSINIYYICIVIYLKNKFMTISTKQILRALLILSWIIFIGVCIEASGCIFSASYTLLINPINAAHFWEGNDLSGLYKYDPGQFFAETLLISIATVLKAGMFYLIVKMLNDKKIDLAKPFSDEVRRFILKISGLSFGIGFFTQWGVHYTEWLVKKGVSMPDTQHLHLGGPDVWFFMGVVLIVIAQIFKRGIEIQTENELTV
jgi:ABC-type Fe3+ transport system permease subunit